MTDPPRVLILVLSCAAPPYDALMDAQHRTWDSVFEPGAHAVYYFSPSPAEMPGALRAALSRALAGKVYAVRDWTHVFRTNASSYVDKGRLVEHASALPVEKCYQGVDGGGFASGSGFFLSRDAAEVLARDLPEQSDTVEDVLVGEILARAEVANLPGARRHDYHLRRQLALAGAVPIAVEEDEIRAAYHVRCKGPEGGDRAGDAAAMRRAHRLKYPDLQ